MADSERPSPFTIPEPTFKFAAGPPSEPRPSRSMTVGGLIHDLTVFADFYERASADIDREEAVEKPRYIWNRNANADVMQRDFRATVAIDRVRAYVLGKYGADLTINTARRLLGDLIKTCGLAVDAAEALPLEEAMDKLDGVESGGNDARIILESKGTPARDEKNVVPPHSLRTTEPAPTGFLGGVDLADALGVHPSKRDAFFKQLERKRTSLGDECWQELSNRRANIPRFQYRVDSPKLRELAEVYKAAKSD